VWECREKDKYALWKGNVMDRHGYLYVKGIEGECDEQKHKKWIEVVSYRCGIKQASVAGGSQGPFGPGGARPTPLTIVKLLDSATPEITLWCCEGKPIDEVKVELCTATGTNHAYMQYILTNAVISDVDQGGHLAGASDRPQESVDFTFEKIEWIYTPVDSKGRAGTPVRSSFDYRANAKS
jgi:type VI secretion system secreted protein Hcp